MSFKLVGIKNKPSGDPELVLDGLMQERWGHCKAHVTPLTHTSTIGLAVVVLEET